MKNRIKLVCLVLVSIIASGDAFASSEERKLYTVWDASLESNQRNEPEHWKVTRKDGCVTYTMVMAGGSTGISFRKGEEIVTLFHDRSFHVTTIKGTDGFPDVDLAKERKDGLLYLGLENFGKGIPVDVNSSLFLELKQEMKKYIESHNLTEGKVMKRFLDTAKKMRSNKAVDTIRVSARRNPNTPDTLNLNPTIKL